MADLILHKDLDFPALFADQKSIEKLLEKIGGKARAVIPKVTTKTGRKEIASLAHKVARSKTILDDAGKGLVASYRKKTREVDVTRKHIRDTLDALKAEVRAPLTEWENVEAKRVESIKESIVSMAGMFYDPLQDGAATKRELIARHETLYDFAIDETFAEFTDSARQSKEDGLAMLETRIAELRELEDARAKAEVLQAEAEKVAREAAELAKREVAQLQAEAEKQAAAAANLDQMKAQLQQEQGEAQPNPEPRALDGQIAHNVFDGESPWTAETSTEEGGQHRLAAAPQAQEKTGTVKEKAEPETKEAQMTIARMAAEVKEDLGRFGADGSLAEIIFLAIRFGQVRHLQLIGREKP